MLLENSEGQPDSIVQDIENMVRSYIEKVVSVQLLYDSMLREQT